MADEQIDKRTNEPKNERKNVVKVQYSFECTIWFRE